MFKELIVTGKSVDEAILAGCEQLGLDRDSVSAEVIEMAAKGFLGIKNTPAKVKLTYEVPDEKPQVKKQAEISLPAEKKEVIVKEEKPHTEENGKKFTRKVAESVPAGLSEKGRAFLNDILTQMNFDAKINITESGNELTYDIEGEGMGLIIGRRGETLDAIQYLVSLVVNHDEEEYIKVTVDSEKYRVKREETLVSLAKKLADKVKKYKKNMWLEPMNANERRIIHSALSEIEGIHTYSVGVEPNRKVIVSLGKEGDKHIFENKGTRDFKKAPKKDDNRFELYSQYGEKRSNADDSI